MTLTGIVPPSATKLADYLPSDMFEYLSPVNLTLAVYIMIQNSMIVYDYYKDWRRLSSFLFILIAAVDIGSACSEVARGTVALMCLRDGTMSTPPWTFVTYLSFGLLSYVTSTFFGMVLTVVKTINIMNPFYTIRERVLRIFLAMFTTLGLVLTMVDIWYNTAWHGNLIHISTTRVHTMGRGMLTSYISECLVKAH